MIIILYSYGRSLSIHLLASLLVILVTGLLDYLLISSNLYTRLPHLVYISIPLFFLVGPCYYAFVATVIKPSFELRTKMWYHLAPLVMAVLFMLPFYLLSAEDKTTQLAVLNESQLLPLTLAPFIFLASQILHSFTYIYYSNTLINRKIASINNRKSVSNLNWLQRFGQIFMAYWAVDLIGLTIYVTIGKINQEVFYVTILCSALLINVLVFFAIRHNREFSQGLIHKEKYKNSALSKALSQQYLDKILEVMEIQKPYLNTDFSLATLAQLSRINTYQISQVLNHELGKNFYEFVNEFRYREAKHRLQQKEYKHLTILAIALESGFTNKNTFNKVFKKHSGITPSEYQKKGTT